MKQLDTNLWVAEGPQRFAALEVGARMTVLRLPDGRLFLHSPIHPRESLVERVRAEGEVGILVAPNKFHHLHVAGWKRRFPDAKIYVAAGLDTKRSDLAIDGVLDDSADAAWADVMEQHAVQGLPLVNEVVFFHRPSRTLILTDLAFNIGPTAAPMTRLFVRVAGTYGALGPTVAERLLVRDRGAFKASLQRILEWPFERVIVAHGDVCTNNAREQLQQGYAWALGDAA